MKKKYKQTYKSKRQDYRKGGRVQKAKGGVNTRSVEPDDVLDKINKPNRPISEPVVDSINKPVMPPVSNGQMSIGGVGGNNVPQPQPNQGESWWKNAGFNSAAEAKAAGWTYEGERGEWVPPGGGTPAGGDTTTDDNTTTTTTTEPTAEELAAQEKTRQQELARQSAEAAARGEVSEAAQIPDAEQGGYQRDAQGQLV